MSSPADSEARIASFIEATSASREEAIQHLEMSEWDVTVAIELWFDGADEPEEDDHGVAEPAPSSNPAPASDPAPARATDRAARAGGIRTLNDLNASAGHADEDDADDTSDNDYFAGGEKSGLAVHGNPQLNRTHELVDGLFQRASR
jgi:UBX domain-containing protein 1